MLYNTHNPHGGDIYSGEIRLDYSANTNPYGTPDAVVTAAANALSSSAHYPDPYCRELVRAIASHEQLPQDMILCGSGAAELIYSYCLAVKPESAAEIAPTFSEYALGLALVGCTPDRYSVRQDAGFMLDESFLPWLREHHPQVLFLCSPNNPTGRTIPRTLMENILGCCDDMGTRVFLDECFLDLSDDPQSMKDCLSEHPGLLILKAFTKSYGMAGLRLGYCLCADGDLLTAMSRTVQPWNISVPAQAAGIAALRETAFLQKTRDLIPVQRKYLSEGLADLGIRVIPADANYILFQGPAGLEKELLMHGIAIRSCSNYHGLDDTWYRIAVRLHEENKTLLSTLAICMERRHNG